MFRIKNVITPTQANLLIIENFRNILYENYDYKNMSLNFILKTINKQVSKIGKRSLITTHEMTPNQPEMIWHSDNQYEWCRYGCSVLLNKDFEGGELCYKDGREYKHYLDLLIHKSDELHMVKQVTKGSRYSLLVFVA